MKLHIPLLLLLICMLGIWFYAENTRVSQDFVYLDTPTSTPPTEEQDCCPKFIKAINAKNNTVRTFYGELKVTASAKITVGLQGNMGYERSKKFRMALASRMGQEIDIGSNDKHFWFWSKRLKPNYIYYADHKDLLKTPLRTPFNPVWMLECIGFHKVPEHNAVYRKLDKYWAVYERRASTLGSTVTKVTLLDDKNLRAAGHYLFAETGEPIAASETMDFQQVEQVWFPKRIKMTWFEENATMEFVIENPVVNHTINSDAWKIPDFRKKMNMADMPSS